MKVDICVIFCFVGAALFAIPNITRRNILFGSAVTPDFRHSADGRRSVAEFRFLIAITLAVVVCALFLLPQDFLALVIVGGPLVLLCAGTLGFLREHRRVARFAVEPLSVREVNVSNAPDAAPSYVWAGAGPFAVLAVAAAYLHVHWREIPGRFPVHWGLDGQPDRWSSRSVHGVYGPLFFAAELCAWMLMTALALWFGARRSHFRRVVFGTLILCEYLIAALVAVLSITPLVSVPVWAVVLGFVILLLPSLIAMAHVIADPREPPDATPNSAWKGGIIYYNPNDPAILVEKRTGLGYTLNFGNRWSLALALGLVCILVTAPLLI
jgi:uncharacterized membrane protein